MENVITLDMLTDNPKTKGLIEKMLDNAKKNKLKIASLSAGLGGFGLFSFSTNNSPINVSGDKFPIKKPELKEEIVEFSNISEDMDFSNAFRAARIQSGQDGYFLWQGKDYNTLYKEEFDLMTESEQKGYTDKLISSYEKDHPVMTSEFKTYAHNQPHEMNIEIHSTAPISTLAGDDMSFHDAFAIARAEVGMGGIFHYEGKTYNTYLQEEFTSMTDAQKQEFYNSIPKDIQIASHDVSLKDNIEIDSISYSVPDGIDSEEIIKEEFSDIVNGRNIMVRECEKNGEIFSRFDHNNDGVFDTTITLDIENNLVIESPAGIESFPFSEYDIKMKEIDEKVMLELETEIEKQVAGEDEFDNIDSQLENDNPNDYHCDDIHTSDQLSSFDDIIL